MTTTQLFLKRNIHTKRLLAGAGLIGGGALLMRFVGPVGAIVIAAGVMAVAAAMWARRLPLVTLDAKNVVLRFGEVVTVPLAKIVRIEKLKDLDMVIWLESGARVLVTMSRLNEDEGEALRTSLKKAARAQNKLNAPGP